jgi:hypothetical protein
MVTSNNPKATKVVKTLGYEVKKNDVLLMELSNKPGAFYPVAQKIADAGINIDYHYATTGGPKGQIVLSTDNNTKAMRIIKQC